MEMGGTTAHVWTKSIGPERQDRRCEKFACVIWLQLELDAAQP